MSSPGMGSVDDNDERDRAWTTEVLNWPPQLVG
jgi:hypothetical protein